MGSVNLSKLKSEIDSRKQLKQNVVLETKEGTSTITIPKDSFLNKLVNSLESGKQNDASKIIKIIEHKAAIHAGEDVVPQQNLLQEEKRIKSDSRRLTEDSFVDPNREDQFYADVINKYKTKQPQQTVNYDQQIPRNNGLNTNNDINALFNEVSEKLAEQLDDKIIEMFAYDRIKKVLHENKDMIKEIVIEIIKELRDKSKK